MKQLTLKEIYEYCHLTKKYETKLEDDVITVFYEAMEIIYTIIA